MFGNLFKRNIDREELIKVALVSAIEVCERKEKHPNLPQYRIDETIDETLLSQAKYMYQQELSPLVLELGRTILLVLLMENNFVQSIYERKKNGLFEGFNNSEASKLKEILRTHLPQLF
jgi:hypothetical protein